MKSLEVIYTCADLPSVVTETCRGCNVHGTKGQHVQESGCSTYVISTTETFDHSCTQTYYNHLPHLPVLFDFWLQPNQSSGRREDGGGGEGGKVDIPGLSMDGHGYSGIRGYSDMGGGGGGGRVDIPGLSVDGHSYSGIRGYSDMGGGGGGGDKCGRPWTIRGWSVTLASADTLTWGGGGWTSLDYPWMVTGTLASADTLTWGGWTSLDYPWMVTVTLASADTLT